MAPLVALLLSAPQIAVGPPTLVIDPGEGFYFSPDAAFPYFPSADAKTKVAVWGPGRPTRYTGSSLDDMVQSGPHPAPVTRAPGIGAGWDSAGTWMLAASRAPDGTLVALTHVEDHTFSDGGKGEWNSSGIQISRDDGKSWTNLGQICGEAKPDRARYGGLDIRVMVWNRGRRAWIGYSGAYAFESKDPHAAPGTWYGYRDGAFSQLIDPKKPAPPLSEAPGLTNGGPQGVTWGSLSWNAYLKKYLYVWRAAGPSPMTVTMALSGDGLHWDLPTTLFALPPPVPDGHALDYPTLVGASSSLTGQDCTLVYAKVPSTGLRRKDMIEHWVHFGPLAKPSAPKGVWASGRPGLDVAVTVSWKAVPMAQAYDVARHSGGGVWSPAGTVRSSSAAPSFVDRAVSLGKTYTYRVIARNSIGVCAPFGSASASPFVKAFTIVNQGSGLVLEGTADGRALQQTSIAGKRAQRWRFVAEGGAGYRIVNDATGWALNNPEGSTVPGTLVDLRPVGEGATVTRWLVQPTGPTVALIDDGSRLCLDNFGNGKSPGTPVDVYPYGGAPNQQWRILASP